MRVLLGNLSVALIDLLLRDAGQDLVEFSLILLLVAVGSVASIPPLADALQPMIGKVTAALGSQ